MKPLYLYAIVGARPRRPLGGKLEIVRAGGFFVVAQRMQAPHPDEEALRAHDRVVRAIAERTPALLPFRFGTVADDVEALSALLEPVAPLVKKSLERVRGCVQFTVRVYGEPKKPKPARGGPGTRFMSALLAARRVPEIDDVAAAVAPFVKATRVERHDRPPLLASVYHLVPRRHVHAYEEALRRAAGAKRRIRISATGPFPPYAFAELT